MKRKVEIFKNTFIPNKTGPGGKYERVSTGKIATFHQFGVNYEEFEDGPGNYSVAICEHDDGSVEGIPINFIKFVDGEELFKAIA